MLSKRTRAKTHTHTYKKERKSDRSLYIIITE